MATRFFLCTTCGNVVVKILDSGVDLVCCGQEMKELVPGITDGAAEKHVPVVERVDDCTIRVKVGSKEHPMKKEHFIQMIYLETEHGGQVQYLTPDCKPEALFCVCKDKPVAVYEYCNIHGLWKTDLREQCITEKCETDKKGCCCK